MDPSQTQLKTPPPGLHPDEVAALLGPGLLTLGPEGEVRFADPRALELLGCEDGFQLERLWNELRPRLESAGLSWSGASATATTTLDLPLPDGTANRRLLFDLRRDPAGGGVLLVQSVEILAGLENDLRLTSQMRSVAQISPAVAHDLRAPINAMVFNIEILKEMLASGRAQDPANRDKLLRYTNVLKEELSRLHKGLETYLAYISPRGDRNEAFDLRELAEELAALLVAPARKQQAQVQAELPEDRAQIEGNRYLLRQALLHLSLAALQEVPKQGKLHVLLESEDGRARLRVYGSAGPDSPPAEETAAAAPAPGFDLRVSAEGTLAQLWVARAIVAAHGGEARAAGPEDPTGGFRAYEVEFTVSGNPGIGNQGVK